MKKEGDINTKVIKHRKHIRYALWLKGFVFIVVGVYLASVGIPTNNTGNPMLSGKLVTEEVHEPETMNNQNSLKRLYRVAGPVMIIIGFLEIILGILTYLGYRKE